MFRGGRGGRIGGAHASLRGAVLGASPGTTGYADITERSGGLVMLPLKSLNPTEDALPSQPCHRRPWLISVFLFLTRGHSRSLHGIRNQRWLRVLKRWNHNHPRLKEFSPCPYHEARLHWHVMPPPKKQHRKHSLQPAIQVQAHLTRQHHLWPAIILRCKDRSDNTGSLIPVLSRNSQGNKKSFEVAFFRLSFPHSIGRYSRPTLDRCSSLIP
ncbi:Hypothetical protein NGAL_HAMBI1189_48790 [Neorhizobium galegae bv. officinalis]|uniref:Uncharacterized protein n=1 Tax=Neorhizobium galegae bv. officinalis TaxID=323656 RepID=A0A0T7H134_NEOGA|nr:Hypothetical protein NGAL_HAMBI1189_48790 [Neorhizobium galegae bv. officinalis]